MFKRRDWIFTHNRDTGDDSSESDDEDASSDEGQSTEGSGSESDEESDPQPGSPGAHAPAKAVTQPSSSPAAGKKRGRAEPPGAAKASAGRTPAAGGSDGEHSGSDAGLRGGDAGEAAELDSGDEDDDTDDDGDGDVDFANVSMERLQELLAQANEAEARNGDGSTGTPQRRKRRRVYSDSEALDQQKEDWLLAPEGEAPRKGAPLRCLLCNGSLLLNSTMFKTHLMSKKHLRAARRGGCGDDQDEQLGRVVWAEAVQRSNLDAETHHERLVRLATEAATKEVKAEVASKKAGKQVRAGKLKGKDAADAKKKPGRRQRQAAKLEKADKCEKGGKPRKGPIAKGDTPDTRGSLNRKARRAAKAGASSTPGTAKPIKAST